MRHRWRHITLMTITFNSDINISYFYTTRMLLLRLFFTKFSFLVEEHSEDAYLAMNVARRVCSYRPAHWLIFWIPSRQDNWSLIRSKKTITNAILLIRTSTCRRFPPPFDRTQLAPSI
jgi:hypothetical protein